MKISHSQKLFLITGILFFLFLGVGLRLAQSRYLWNDEIFTQLSSIDKSSFARIAIGDLKEGNNAPLFYFLQKITVSAFHYQAPSQWDGRPKAYDTHAQIVVRVNSVLFMSLMLAIVFFYFSMRMNISMGFLALTVFLTSGTIWTYWAEGRPYGLGLVLSVLQLLFFLDMYLYKGSKKLWVGLLALNCLMSLTILFSIFQVMITATLLALKFKDYKKALLLYIAPFFITILYYIRGEHYMFYFNKPPLELVLSVVLPAQICFIVLYFIVSSQSRIGSWTGTSLKGLLGLMAIAACALTGLLILKNFPDPRSFALSDRYYIFLVPTVLISMIVFLSDLFSHVRSHKEWRLPFSCGVFLFFVYLVVSQQEILSAILGIYLT